MYISEVNTVPLGSCPNSSVTYNNLRLNSNNSETEIDDCIGDSTDGCMEVEEYLEEVKDSEDTE